MRCPKCKWPNKPNETNCIKCGAPLTGGNMDFEATSFVPQSSPAPAAESLKKTVREDMAFGGGMAGNPVGMVGAPRPEHTDIDGPSCPKCGYPLRHDTSVCPNCKSVLKKPVSESTVLSDAPVSRPAAPVSRPAAPADKPAAAQKPLSGTINPYLMGEEQVPSFSLKPVRKINEKHDMPAREYEGEEVTLTRSNTDEANASITSREQAVLTNVDGKWFIEDRSSQHTTFVLASHKVELHDGDTILLGNRLFTFHE